jgi:hypothetical protein
VLLYCGPDIELLDSLVNHAFQLGWTISFLKDRR